MNQEGLGGGELSKLDLQHLKSYDYFNDFHKLNSKSFVLLVP